REGRFPAPAATAPTAAALSATESTGCKPSSLSQTGPPRSRPVRAERSSLPLADRFAGGGVGRGEELLDAGGSLSLADGSGGAAECVEGAEESAVDLVGVRDRPGPAPSGSPQGVEAAMVADAGVGIGIDEAALLVGFIGEFGPGQRRRRKCRGHVDGLLTGV